jgi:hypothetical protein
MAYDRIFVAGGDGVITVYDVDSISPRITRGWKPSGGTGLLISW